MCGVCNIRERAREARPRYFGHVKTRDEEEPVTGRRSVGRQGIRRRDLLKRDMQELGLQGEEAMARNK